MSNPITKFLTSSFSIVAHVFNLLTNRVDSKALELREKAENDVNIKALRLEYTTVSNEKLANHADAITSIRADMIKNEKQILSDEAELQKTAVQINFAEDKIKTVNMDDMEYSERIGLEFQLKSMKLEAKTLMNEISFNRNYVHEQMNTVNEMVLDYHQNKYRAKEVISKMKSLENRDILLKTKQAVEQIELGTANLKIADIQRIVEGKEAIFEAKKFSDTVLLRGDKSSADKFIEMNNDIQADEDLENILQGVRSGKSVKTLTLNNVNPTNSESMKTV